MKKLVRIASITAAVAFSWVFLDRVADAEDAVQAAILAGLIAVAGAIINQRSMRAADQEARLHEAKRRVYQEFVSSWMALLRSKIQSGQSGTDLTTTEIEDLNRRKTDLMMWASPVVITAWNKLEEDSQPGERAPAQTMLLLEDAIRAMRQDLGHDDSELPRGEIVGLMLTPESKKEIRALLGL